MTLPSTLPSPAVSPGLAPCPIRLTLELGPDGRLVFVSDTHLSGGGPLSDFAATPELAELLADLHEHPGQVILVLGGDILDLLQAQQPGQEALDGPWTEPSAARTRSRSARRCASWGRALA
jgi:hypothetical protein